MDQREYTIDDEDRKRFSCRFPFLVDPNTGKSMYESSEIVKYLFQQYGKGRSPSMGLLESPLSSHNTLLRDGCQLFFGGRGMTLWEKARTESPSKKLELFSYENNPHFVNWSFLTSFKLWERDLDERIHYLRHLDQKRCLTLLIPTLALKLVTTRRFYHIFGSDLFHGQCIGATSSIF
ncbi:hypothetical protein LOK49_LG11G01326 [Camellia lanceoleosa]|uniref:Uncharacterized protein n=1 Tax=Camellia lanceoleosa TaxID=1840588 RepID=A0ACC0FZW0_9ERIC|nr:hypothetical protein LOK49_LG11G01326 [Camellia lanceoleosa]